MSPRIDLAISLRSWSRALRTPPQKVFASLMRMRAQRIPLRYGESGVSYRPAAAGEGGGWHLAHAAGVSLVGAVLLSFPPEPGLPPGAVVGTPVEFAAQALEVPVAYAEGLDDGWHRREHSRLWLENFRRSAYLDGYETGMEARFRATVLCNDCGARRFRSERTCPRCAGST